MWYVSCVLQTVGARNVRPSVLFLFPSIHRFDLLYRSSIPLNQNMHWLLFLLFFFTAHHVHMHPCKNNTREQTKLPLRALPLPRGHRSIALLSKSPLPQFMKPRQALAPQKQGTFSSSIAKW